MLDIAVEQQYIFTYLSEKESAIKELITSKAQERNLYIYDITNISDFSSLFLENCKGAFFSLQHDPMLILHIIDLLKFLPVIFLLTDDETQAPRASSFMSCNRGYKKIGEKIDAYFDIIANQETSIFVKEKQHGALFTTYGNIEQNPYPGIFIAVDYPDNSIGTQVTKEVTKQLQQYHQPIYYTNEPTNELSGGIVKSAQYGKVTLSPDSLQLLYTIDRIEHFHHIAKSLKEGTPVITARYTFSTLAYAYHHMPLGFLLAANAQIYWPDITIVLIQKQEKRDKLSKHAQDIQEGYEMVAHKFSHTSYLFDIDEGEQKLVKQILRTIKAHPKFKNFVKSLS